MAFFTVLFVSLFNLQDAVYFGTQIGMEEMNENEGGRGTSSSSSSSPGGFEEVLLQAYDPHAGNAILLLDKEETLMVTNARDLASCLGCADVNKEAGMPCGEVCQLSTPSPAGKAKLAA